MSAGHDHAGQGHGHAHGIEGTSDARLFLAVGVNLLLTVAQVVGGVISGSLSLVADALHNLNDAASLGIALVARRIARRPADRYRTFGYRRAEVIGALINLTTLVIVGLYLVYEAIARFFEPSEVGGWTMIVVAGVALVVDVITALLTFASSKESLNIKAAFIHNVADALGSIGVILAGVLVLLYDWNLADPILTLVIAAYVLYQGLTLIPRSIRTLMEGVPADIDLNALVRELDNLDDIREVHHVHVWELDEQHRALEAHVVLDETDFETMERTKKKLKRWLADHYDIHHSTLEFERPRMGRSSRSRADHRPLSGSAARKPWSGRCPMPDDQRTSVDGKPDLSGLLLSSRSRVHDNVPRNRPPCASSTSSHGSSSAARRRTRS